MPNSKKYTTSALDKNQHLLLININDIVEAYCHGYTNNKRDKSIDGYYFKSELVKK